MSDKIKIRLTPFDALEILTFLKEWEQQMSETPECEALNTAINRFYVECFTNISPEQIEEARAEREVNRLLDKRP